MNRLNRQILQLALPSIISNITVPLLGLCDVTIMGHIGGATHIGAIAVGSMIFNVMYWLFVFLRMGTSGLTAQAYGKGGEARDRDGGTRFAPSPKRILQISLFIGIMLGVAIVMLQIPLKHLMFWLMQVTDDVRELCTPYYYICIWGAPAVLGLYSLSGWFIGMQNTRIPMAIAICQNIVNIATSLLLVLEFRMGIVGVALGTLVSQWTAFIAALLLSERLKVKNEKYDCYESSQSDRKSNHNTHFPSFISHFTHVYLDIFLRTICLVAVNLYFTSAGAAQGAEILAANTLLMQFFMFFSYVMDGFANAGEALAGKSYGAGDRKQLNRVVRNLFGWGTGVAAVFTIAYWLGGTTVLHLLTTDNDVVSTASTFLPWAVLIPVAGMAAFVWDGIFIGITATRGMLWSCFIAAVLFFAIYFSLSAIMGNHALWLALLLYLTMRGAVQTMLFGKAKP